MYSVVVLFAHVYEYLVVGWLVGWFFSFDSNIWYSLVHTVKRVLSVNVYCWNWTQAHTAASRWEKRKKRQCELYIQNATAKQKLTKRISRWYALSSKQDYIQTYIHSFIHEERNEKKCNPSFCMPIWISVVYNKLHSFLCALFLSFVVPKSPT